MEGGREGGTKKRATDEGRQGGVEGSKQGREGGEDGWMKTKEGKNHREG